MVAEIAEVIAGARRYHVEQGEVLRALMALPDACADLVMADAPYSSGGQFRGDRMNAAADKYQRSDKQERLEDFTGDNRDQRSFLAWCSLWIHEARRASKPGAVCCLFTDWRQLPVTTDALQAGGWIWRGIVPWNKTEAARPQKGRFRAQCEYVVWGSNGPMSDDGPALPGFFEKYLVPTSKVHIAEKPVDIMREIVAIAPAGGLALDLFAGSATGSAAALEAGLRSIAVELLPHNVEIARARLANVEQGKPPAAKPVAQETLFRGVA